MSAYLPFASPLLLLLIAGLLAGLAVAQPKFKYYWLTAVLGSLAAWPLAALALQESAQTRLELVQWEPITVYRESPALLMDAFSWPFVFALATLALAVLLTDVARAGESNWSVWSGSLFLIALGMLAVSAGNPLTLALLWAAIDLSEFVILLGTIETKEVRERLVVGFSARVGGTLVLLGAYLSAEAGGSRLNLSQISQNYSIYLLLAAGLRLGVIPLHQPFLREVPVRRSLGTTSRLVSAASSLILLVRTATAGVQSSAVGYMLALSCLAALYASIAWLRSRDELDGRPYWLLGAGSFALAAAVQSQAQAALSWSLALLFSGSLLFLYSGRHASIRLLVALGLLGFLGFPYTPNAAGMQVYRVPIGLGDIALLLAQSLLVVGYLRHGMRLTPPLAGVERWVWAIYPWGLTLLPLVHFGAGWWLLGSAGLELPWQGMAVAGLSAVWILTARRLTLQGLRAPLERLGKELTSILSLEWLYRAVWRLYRPLRRLLDFLSSVVEGEGGVLWALLFLVLFMAILSQLNPGDAP
jgi:hypothetical protein